MKSEKVYLVKRVIKAGLQSLLFYMNRIFPVKDNKIVFTSIEGICGYSCNPKYIAEEIIRRQEDYELVWLVDDCSKEFPGEIRKVKNTLWNRAHELTTAHFWVDNSRKQLECRKRKGQIYIQTWHAQLAIKPIGLQRGSRFSEIAQIVSRHDSEMIDYFTSNSEWFTNQLPEGNLYKGTVIKTGSARCDILINGRICRYQQLRKEYGLCKNQKILLYCPTFRSGSMGTKRSITMGNAFPDLDELLKILQESFQGEWIILLRLHPQLAARGTLANITGNKNVIDVSSKDDLYEIMAGCDCFISDYSASAFDAALMGIPVFLYMKDYKEYVEDRGSLVWNISEIPFPVSFNDAELRNSIASFEEKAYKDRMNKFFGRAGLLEDGMASKRIVDLIVEKSKKANG